MCREIYENVTKEASVLHTSAMDIRYLRESAGYVPSEELR